MNRVQTPTVWIGAAIAFGTLAGCGGGGGATGQGPKPTPTIIVDGSSTVVRISEAAQNGFKEIDPSVQITVDEHGTGGGFDSYLRNEVDIVDASREAKSEEEKKAKEQGLEWTRFVVGYDGITVVVNSTNDYVKELTVEQLKGLWAPGSRVKTWKDLDPSWPDREIALYSPDNDSGTFDYFTEAIVGKAKSQRDHVQQNSSDNSLCRVWPATRMRSDTSVTRITRPTRTSSGPSPSATVRTRRPSCRARKRSGIRPMSPSLGRFSST